MKEITKKATITTDEVIMNKIYLIREKKVMIDKDLAELYGVSTSRLNEAVKRNKRRFPEDFMLQLTDTELIFLISQNAISKGAGRGGIRKLPFVFTEQGVAMLSSILNSEIAIDVNIQIIRIFTKMREMMLTHKDILLQLEKIEHQVGQHDKSIKLIFEHMKQLLNPDLPPRARVGFRRNNEERE